MSNIVICPKCKETDRISKKNQGEKNRGKELNMSYDEIAFYDALGVNDSAVKILGDETENCFRVNRYDKKKCYNRLDAKRKRR